MLLWKRLTSITVLFIAMTTFSYAESSIEENAEKIVIESGATVSEAAHRLVGRGGNEWREDYVSIGRPLADGSYKVIPKTQASNVQVGDVVFVRKSALKNQHSLLVQNLSLTEVCSEYSLNKRQCSRIARRNGIKNYDNTINAVLFSSKPWTKVIANDQSEVTGTSTEIANTTTTTPSPNPTPGPTPVQTVIFNEPNLENPSSERASQKLEVSSYLISPVANTFIFIAIILYFVIRHFNFAIGSLNPRNFNRLTEFRKELIRSMYRTSNFDANDYIKVKRWQMQLQFATHRSEFSKIARSMQNVLPTFASIEPQLELGIAYRGLQKEMFAGTLTCNNLSAWNPSKMSVAELTELSKDIHSTLFDSLKRRLVPLAVSHSDTPHNGSEEEIMNSVARSKIDCSIEKNSATVTLIFAPGKQLSNGDESYFGNNLAGKTKFGDLTFEKFKRSTNGLVLRYYFRYLQKEEVV